ncbi:Uncharacterised protein [Bordetella pertussis]|nr:Uncharacterised protein [Bordetella pertussis]
MQKHRPFFISASFFLPLRERVLRLVARAGRRR